jgi:hypothetical protein
MVEIKKKNSSIQKQFFVHLNFNNKLWDCTLCQAYYSANSMSMQFRRAIKSFHHTKIIIITSLSHILDPRYLDLATMFFKIIYISVKVLAQKITKNKWTVDSLKNNLSCIREAMQM